jgi:hypothetical protein
MTTDTTKHACGRPAKVTDPEIVARVLALAHLSEQRAADRLSAEGVKIGARTVGKIRARQSAHHRQDDEWFFGG